MGSNDKIEKKETIFHSPIWEIKQDRHTDRQTDRQTDKQTDKTTERK